MRCSSSIHIERRGFPYGGYRAWGIRFDGDANVIAETESCDYMFYTKREIEQKIRAELKEKAGR